MEDSYYVYEHYDQGELVYVGKGTGGRIVATTRAANKSHNQFVKDRLNSGDLSFARFVATGLTESEALDVERELIKQHQPRYNRRYTDSQAVRAREVAKQASEASMKPIQTPDGQFESISAAARHYGVTPGAIWHRIKDKPEDYYYVTKEKITI
jgi:hypothetical protein